MALDGKLNPSFYSKSSKLLQANGEMIIVKKKIGCNEGSRQRMARRVAGKA
jgi:hypothetical protein